MYRRCQRTRRPLRRHAGGKHAALPAHRAAHPPAHHGQLPWRPRRTGALGSPGGDRHPDIDAPEFGDAVDIREGEVPVFWACGVTPQTALEGAKLPLAVTHSPGYMMICDLLEEELMVEIGG